MGTAKGGLTELVYWRIIYNANAQEKLSTVLKMNVGAKEITEEHFPTADGWVLSRSISVSLHGDLGVRRTGLRTDQVVPSSTVGKL